VANVLLEMAQGNNAVRVLEQTARLARTPDEIQSVEQQLNNARKYAAAQEQEAELKRAMVEAAPGAATAMADSSASVEGTTLRHRDTFVAKGPHHFLLGVLKNVHCDVAQLDLNVDASGKSLTLHAENYFKIQFSALNFAPSSDLNPCKDLEGRPAKVEYVEAADKSVTARLLSIELHK
jgi:hypothetical protein